MHTIKRIISLDVFNKGDRVLTTQGMGTVAEDEIIYDIDFRITKVILDEPTSHQNKGDVIVYDSDMLIFNPN